MNPDGALLVSLLFVFPIVGLSHPHGHDRRGGCSAAEHGHADHGRPDESQRVTQKVLGIALREWTSFPFPRMAGQADVDQ